MDFLKPTSVYDPDRFNLDRELLRRYYVKNGYADMRVVSAVADVDREGKGFFLTFTIDEGQRYEFGTVNVESTLPDFNTGDARGKLLTKTGDIYNAELVDKTVEYTDRRRCPAGLRLRTSADEGQSRSGFACDRRNLRG